MGRLRLPFALYPAAIPVAAVLNLWAAAIVHPVLLVRPVLFAVAISLVITAIATALLRERHRAALAAFSFVVALTVNDLRIVALLVLLGAIVLAVGFRQRNEPWPRGPLVTRAMSALGSILILASLLQGVQVGAIQAAVQDVRRGVSHGGPAASFDPGAPDIYLILLDGYPGASASAREPAFDAEAFPAALRSRGFDVASRSRSNYLITRLTLPSVFGYTHLPNVPDLHPGTVPDDARWLRWLTDDAPSLRLLGDAGYERIAVASGFSDLGPEGLDRNVIVPQLNEFETAILRTVGLGDVLDMLSPTLGASQQRARIADTFAAVRDLAAEPHERPRFVFVHVAGPHAPWVNNADGSAQNGQALLGEFTPQITDLDERRDRFFSYATYIGTEALAAVDDIVATSRRPLVIAIFSDHGPDIDFDSHDPFGSNLDERTSNLVAVAAPGRRDIIPDDTTPVNLVPYIFNSYLGTDLLLQPNTMWAWRTGSSILDFVEIDPLSWQAKGDE
jgi:hypothetical protein